MAPKNIYLQSEVASLKANELLHHYFVGDELVRKVFAEHPSNSNYDDVLIKVLILDYFYNSSLRYRQNGVSLMARHIVQLSVSENLDEKIKEGDLDAVRLVRTLTGSSDYLSFATKYCCNSNQTDSFYIYDRYVERIMYKFASEHADLFDIRITHKGLKDYKTYFGVCEKYKEFYCLKGSRRETDWYLWGNELLRRRGIW